VAYTEAGKECLESDSDFDRSCRTVSLPRPRCGLSPARDGLGTLEHWCAMVTEHWNTLIFSPLEAHQSACRANIGKGANRRGKRGGNTKRMGAWRVTAAVKRFMHGDFSPNPVPNLRPDRVRLRVRDRVRLRVRNTENALRPHRGYINKCIRYGITCIFGCCSRVPIWFGGKLSRAKQSFSIVRCSVEPDRHVYTYQEILL
jgi:hypothetical protein